MSPERCLGQDYSFASDIWSVGMVIYDSRRQAELGHFEVQQL